MALHWQTAPMLQVDPDASWHMEGHGHGTRHPISYIKLIYQIMGSSSMQYPWILWHHMAFQDIIHQTEDQLLDCVELPDFHWSI